ncbi:hypothetical protein GCM10011415_23760 [Salipiger pallidus]|uniref:Uncharacterized protein n=1 Tax=Salipiger pallidus TaxID=1775170 RepID=A0A8J2ZKP8_9RHOB|nr:UPF0280 family protein [Salipiger pallidus]GGG74510.1 hypothetical protein GCM10011415_23760 [Salipiger pallidus]
MSFHDTPAVQVARDGRIRLTHGPIDLILRAEGPTQAIAAALTRARDAFEPILTDLCAELPRLRRVDGPAPQGEVARRMQSAADLFAPAFVTPMAAVAGSVADHVLAAMLTPGHGLERAHVNNGGDIALWTAGRPFRLAICEDPTIRAPGGRATIGTKDGIGGIATSGWRGRSHSLGIADAVTVLARDAALADVAATLIANAVNLPGHPTITRLRACDLAPDSDLGDRPVTTDVGPLTPSEITAALDSGARLAQDFIGRGLIRGACLALAGERIAFGSTIDAHHEEPAHA